jgi:hypothetical protein
LDQSWCVEYDITEEDYNQFVELMSIDVGHDVVHVFAVPFERKTSESGEDGACPRRRASASLVRARQKGLESECKFIEAGQRGEGSDHRLG